MARFNYDKIHDSLREETLTTTFELELSLLLNQVLQKN
jgi:hypothetical protein